MAREVTIYTTAVCPQCGRARQFFEQQGVSVHEVDIGDDPELAQQLQQKTGAKIVPVIELNGEYYAGFNRKKLQRALHEGGGSV